MDAMANTATFQNIEAEYSVLSSLLVDPDCCGKILPILRPMDFWLPENGIIYRAIVNLCANNKHVDFVTIAEELKKTEPNYYLNQTHPP